MIRCLQVRLQRGPAQSKREWDRGASAFESRFRLPWEKHFQALRRARPVA